VDILRVRPKGGNRFGCKSTIHHNAIKSANEHCH